MKKIFLPIAIITAFTLGSCGGDKSTDVIEETTVTEGATCFYSYDETAGAQVRWTAFKTSEKIGVGGQFDQVNAF